MSRQINPNNVSREDVEYLRVRPFLLREFQMQGYGNPLDPDYEGLNFDPESDDDENEDSPAPSPADEDSNDSDDDDEGDSEDEDERPEDPGYEDWTKDRLNAEIDSRNEDREEGDKIVPESKKNAALAYSLREDDKASSE